MRVSSLLLSLVLCLPTTSLANAAGGKWLIEAIKEAWTSTSKAEKTITAAGSAGAVDTFYENAVRSSGAADLYNARRNNPGAVLPTGAIQQGQKNMVNALCSVLSEASCYRVDGATKGMAAIGEFQNQSRRNDLAASTGRTSGERLQNLVESLKMQEAERASIVKDFQQPMEDRSFGITRATLGMLQSGMDQALQALATTIGEQFDYNEDGRACGDMLWYMSLGERCQPYGKDEGIGQIGMRTVNGGQCSPIPRDLMGFAEIVTEGEGNLYGCPVQKREVFSTSIHYTLSCPQKGQVTVLLQALSNSPNLRLTYLGGQETHRIDYEPCDVGEPIVDQCTPAVIAERKRRNPGQVIYDCPNP
jgi:hypothetical protein